MSSVITRGPISKIQKGANLDILLEGYRENLEPILRILGFDSTKGKAGNGSVDILGYKLVPVVKGTTDGLKSLRLTVANNEYLAKHINARLEKVEDRENLKTGDISSKAMARMQYIAHLALLTMSRDLDLFVKTVKGSSNCDTIWREDILRYVHYELRERPNNKEKLLDISKELWFNFPADITGFDKDIKRITMEEYNNRKEVI